MLYKESFRFVHLVPPRRRPISLSLDLRVTPFARRILTAREQGQGARDIRAVVRELAEDDAFRTPVEELRFTDPLQGLLEALRRSPLLSLTNYNQAILEATGRSAASLLEEEDFNAFRDTVNDRLLALKILPDIQTGGLGTYVDLQRAISVIERVASRDRALEDTLPPRLLGGALELPDQIFPLPFDRPDPIDEPEDETAREVNSLRLELAELESAAEEVLTLGAADLEEVGPEAVLVTGRPRAARPEPLLLSAQPGERFLVDPPPMDFEPDSRVFLRQSSIAGLTEHTQRTITSVGIETEPTGLGALIDRLEARASVVAARAETLARGPASARFLTIGGTTLPANVPPFPAGGSLANPEHPGVPTSVGPIRPTHVGLLRKTKQHILRYEAEEIAHVENVVIGETKTRDTRRLRRTEETTIVEEEAITEEERDLQTTDRMELQREAQQTLKQSQQFKIGASVSASYGPVEVTVDTEFSTDSSLESINRTASSYAREVLERTAQRISQRVRREEIVRTIQEFEENNEHGFENTTDQHIAAMFQWLVKVYRAQVFDYGARLWMNVTVPEPQFFLVNTLRKEKGPLADLVEPDPIDFTPAHLAPDNYMTYVQKYMVDGVEPPPERKKVISKIFRFPETTAPQSDRPPEEFTGGIELPIEEGYKAVEAYVICNLGSAMHGSVFGQDDGHLYGVELYVGKVYRSFISDQVNAIKANYTFALQDQTGSLMIGYKARNIFSFNMGIEITLFRTGRALNNWKLRTYDAIVARYQALLAEYRERKAELEAQAGIVIQGRNPLENRILERTELTRSALAMITGQNFEEFDAILGFMDGRIDTEQALPEGRYARFFMNCFEWENMTYEFYPYFWGRRSTWKEKLLLQDVDPLHAAFLKCGYADMQLPVRPGYEAALMHWLDTGRIWQGEEPPEVTNPRYVPFLDHLRDLREDENAHVETPFGDPWEVTLPTTLVRIRPGNSLPEWELNAETGEFVPVPEPAPDPA